MFACSVWIKKSDVDFILVFSEIWRWVLFDKLKLTWNDGGGGGAGQVSFSIMIVELLLCEFKVA